MRSGYLLGAALIAVVPVSAHAQDKAGEASALIDALMACRGVADSGARLACMDKATAALAEARDSRRIVVLDRESARKAKRTVFGFSLPNIKLFGGNDEPEVTEITDTVESAAETGHGLWVIRLKDGSSWQTTEEQLSFGTKAGDSIRIQAGMLGSYRVSVNGRRSIRVKRLR
ncbi:MAG: hypothetical protein ABW182_13220 [Sphingomonas sp.]